MTQHRRAAWTSAALLALGTLAACAGDDGGQSASDAVHVTESDSAGVRIVVSSDEALVTASAWVVDTVPDLELGEVEGDVPLQFQKISGIVGLPDGGVVVVDGGSRELRWFDASGEHVRTTGGRGQGPGEFLDPLLIPQYQADSLLIFDRVRRAFSWIAIDGSGERRLRPGGQLFGGTPLVSAGSRVLFTAAASGFGSCPENEGCQIPVLLCWVDVTGTGADTLAAQERRWLNFSEAGVRLLLHGPLDQKGVAAVGPDGPVIEGDPGFELRQFDAAGRLIAIFRVDAAPRGAPEEALERYIQPVRDPGEKDEMKRIYQMMGLPEVLPAFQALRVDRLGWYWAELFRVGEARASEWLVFDPEGRARGMVELPGGLEVHEIGEDYILGRWIDELGVEYVRRHALDRRGS